jgi:hypothetical protein
MPAKGSLWPRCSSLARTAPVGCDGWWVADAEAILLLAVAPARRVSGEVLDGGSGRRL